MATVYISLGSNMGDAQANIKQALDTLSQCGTVIKTSSLYKTEPVGDVPQEWYVNCVVRFDSSLSTVELLREFMNVEKEMGRVRTIKNGPRIIDIDILMYDDLVIAQTDLVIPHLRLVERRFVLVPFAEIAGDVVHPILQKTIQELLESVSDSSQVILLE